MFLRRNWAMYSRFRRPQAPGDPLGVRPRMVSALACVAVSLGMTTIHTGARRCGGRRVGRRTCAHSMRLIRTRRVRLTLLLSAPPVVFGAGRGLGGMRAVPGKPCIHPLTLLHAASVREPPRVYRRCKVVDIFSDARRLVAPRCSERFGCDAMADDGADVACLWCLGKAVMAAI